MAPVDYSQRPAFPPPPGITANFDNPPSIAWQITAFSLPFSGAATIFVALRLYARAHILRFLGLDDLFLVLALVMSWAFSVLEIASIPYGYGVDVWNLRISEVITFLKLDLGAYITYYLGTLFVKLSLLLFYLRVNPDRIFRRIVYAIGAFEITYILISMGIAIFGCSPVARSWNFYIPGTCVDKEAYFYAQTVFNIITDFATLVLPIRMCVRLQLPTRQKWMLSLTFAVGSFACIVSIVRLVTLLPAFHSINFTVFKVNIEAWCEVEINTGIICASLPCLKPILACHFPSFMKNASTNSLTNNASKHIRENSQDTSTGSYQVTMRGMEANKNEERNEEERNEEEGNEEEGAAEEIKSQIRGWSMGESRKLGVVSEVSVEERIVIVERSSVGSETEMLAELGRKKSTKEMGGVTKTVAYDVTYES